MWHGIAMLPRLRALSGRELLALMRQVDVHLDQSPVWLTGEKRYPMLGDKQGLTGAQLTAVMVFGLWVYVGEDERAAGGLMGDWGLEIRSALMLAPKESSDG